MNLPFEITYEILKMVVLDKLRFHSEFKISTARLCTDLLGNYGCGLFLAEFFPKRDKSGNTNTYCAYEAFKMILSVHREIRGLLFYYDTVKYSVTEKYGSFDGKRKQSNNFNFLSLTHPRDVFDLSLFLYKDKFKLEPE